MDWKTTKNVMFEITPLSPFQLHFPQRVVKMRLGFLPTNNKLEKYKIMTNYDSIRIEC